ncbi:MAG: threonine--tRNA ligase, partial [Desulfomonilaceae bacterium]
MNPSIEILVQDTAKTYGPGITAAEILKDVCPSNRSEILAAQINGKQTDLHSPIMESGKLDFISVNTPKGLEILRHSTAHIMAQAVKELFPDVKVTIGPAIADGFYYDFDSPRPFTPEDLEKIEVRMKEIIKSKLPFRKVVLPKEEAIQFLRELGE